MPKVTVYDGNFEKALRKFKRAVSSAGTLETLRSKEAHEKPSTKRQRALAQAKARYSKKLRTEALPPRNNRNR